MGIVNADSQTWLIDTSRFMDKLCCLACRSCYWCALLMRAALQPAALLDRHRCGSLHLSIWLLLLFPFFRRWCHSLRRLIFRASIFRFKRFFQTPSTTYIICLMPDLTVISFLPINPGSNALNGSKDLQARIWSSREPGQMLRYRWQHISRIWLFVYRYHPIYMYWQYPTAYHRDRFRPEYIQAVLWRVKRSVRKLLRKLL